MILMVAKESPEIFYTEPKTNVLDISLSLRTTGQDDRDGWYSVEVNLIYDNFALIDNQGILEPLVVEQFRVKLNEAAAFQFHMKEVSRAHLNRRFPGCIHAKRHC